MPKYVIERTVPGVHARGGGFPADRITEAAAIIDPTTAVP
jgi:hypothetical protein